MRIVVHDYAGHPGEAYLSRALGRRGHEVLHLYFGSNETPRGAVVKLPGDAPTFQVEGIFLEKPFQKHTYVRRVLQEIEYGRLMVDRIAKFKPDVVLCGCTPMLPQARLVKKCREWNAGFVFWVMDLYGKAVMAGLRRKLPGIGHLAGAYFTQLEKKLLRQSDRIVVITEGFASTIDKWGLPKDRIDVEPLWPPIDELPVLPKVNDWSRKHGFERTTNLIYGGTLGSKHNPETLAVLAERYRSRSDVRVIVLSEGVGQRYLQKRKAEAGLENLVLMPFQPYEQLPQVFAAADVLLVLLEAAAGEFSAPGKVLSHLCAQRPQVAAVPLINRAAKVIQESGSGFAIPVGDDQGFVNAVDKLLSDEALRQKMGRKARAYAETEFDIDKIAERFERILAAACH